VPRASFRRNWQENGSELSFLRPRHSTAPIRFKATWRQARFALTLVQADLEKWATWAQREADHRSIKNGTIAQAVKDYSERS
jgi:hypothetical protein